MRENSFSNRTALHNNIQVLAHCIVTILTKLSGKYIVTTSCILQVEIDEVISIWEPQLVMVPTVHLKDEAKPAQLLLTTINLLDELIQIGKHTIKVTF